MHLRKSTLIISIAGLIISLLWPMIFSDFAWSRVSDLLFSFTLFFLIIGSFLWVCASGLLDFFQYSWKKAFRKTKEDYLTLSEIGRTSYRFWLEPALILFLLSLVFLGLAFL